jgi:hypothetical protein
MVAGLPGAVGTFYPLLHSDHTYITILLRRAFATAEPPVWAIGVGRQRTYCCRWKAHYPIRTMKAPQFDDGAVRTAQVAVEEQ